MNASRENTPALEVAGLSYSYGRKPALEDVSFTLRGGEFKVLLGPNGAGKTTLFSLITRLFESRDGTIRVDGIGLRRRAGRALQRMGVVFQQPTLDLDLTVRQNLLYHASLHGIAKSEAAERIETELARFEMADRRGETVRRLNGGHRRRVEIARALLHRPMLLLLDEPTVGLDVPTRRAIVEHVHQLCLEEGTAVLWATHLIDEVFDDDNVIVLHEGRVRADGGAAAVIAAVAAESIGEAFDRLTNGGSA